ncbi:MAG: hypothetical protein V1726_00185 [Methanobacteriota archaeon]
MHIKKILQYCFILMLIFFSIPAEARTQDTLLPTGRIQITQFQVPDTVNTGETFTVTVTLQNNRFRPAQLMIRLDLLDGVLNLIQKNIGETTPIRCPGKTTLTFDINCLIREGDTDWYKEEYNIQAVLLQKVPVLGWITRDTSTTQGTHTKSPLTEKNKINIIHLTVPEILEEHQTTFNVTLQVANEGLLDATTWVKISLIQKPSILPEIEPYYTLQGLATERTELGRSNEKNIPAGTIETFTIKCQLRETETTKEQFNIEATVYVNLNGEQQQVDTSTLQGIYHKQPFLENHILPITAIIFGVLIMIFLIVLIMRILYPAYYIKRRKLQEEKQRIQRKKP